MASSLKESQLRADARRHMAEGRFAAAANALARLARTRPRDAALLRNLAAAEIMAGDVAAARKTAKKAIKLDPGDPVPHCVLAETFKQENRLDEALRAVEGALRRNPDHPTALWNKADFLRLAGRFDEAYELLKPHADAPDVDPGIALVHARLLARVASLDEAIDRLARRVARDDLRDVQRAQMRFVLGELLDKAARYDEAFETFRLANEGRGVACDVDEIRRNTDRLVERWSKERLQAMPRATNRTERPVFIVGLPRSGTSLLEQILASHPRVFGAGELRAMSEIARDLLDPYGGAPALALDAGALTPAALDRAASRYERELNALDRRADRVTDKRPYNFELLGLISRVLPGARILHCRRNLLDACLSCYFHDFIGAHEFAYDLTSLGVYARQYERLMQHWRNALPTPVLDVVYEELVNDLEGTVRRVLDHLDLEFDDACLRFFETDRASTTSSSEQIREPINDRSVGRHRHYERHLGPLREALGITTDPRD